MIVIPEKAIEPPPLSILPAATPTKPKPKTEFPKLKKAANYSRAPMTEAEMAHFNSDAVSLGQLFAKLEPIVKAYAREQTASPPTYHNG